MAQTSRPTMLIPQPCSSANPTGETMEKRQHLSVTSTQRSVSDHIMEFGCFVLTFAYTDEECFFREKSHP
jgi:hypothetical protein